MNKKVNHPQYNLSLYRRGKVELEKYYSLGIKRSTNIISLLIGFVTTIILILPIALLIYQTLMIYGYNYIFIILSLISIWIGLLIFNGISNYLIILISKSLEKENIGLQEINPKPVFFSQTFSLGYAIFSLVIVVFLAIQVMGVI